MRKSKLILVAVLVVLVLAPAAIADTLAKHGPIVPYVIVNPANPRITTGNGYPRYYMDKNGVMADSQVPPFANIVPDPKVPGATILGAPMMIFGPVNTANQFSQDIGFDAEFFYFLAQPDRATFDDLFPGGATKILNVLIGLEAGFAGTGATINGQQAVFQRIRFNWRKSAPAGFYRFLHPYGVEEDPLLMQTTGVDPVTGLGDLLFTIDTPVATNIPPNNFDVALGDNPFAPGKIGPFLRQVNPPPVIAPSAPGFTIPAGFNKPTDWLGDGVTAATFTGSPPGTNGDPNGYNRWRIEAYTDAAHTQPLNIFPTTVGGLPTVNFVETNLGLIAGHRLHIPVIAPLDLLLLD